MNIFFRCRFEQSPDLRTDGDWSSFPDASWGQSLLVDNLLCFLHWGSWAFQESQLSASDHNIYLSIFRVIVCHQWLYSNAKMYAWFRKFIRWFAYFLVVRQVRKQTHVQGMSRHTPQEVAHIGRMNLEALEGFIGEYFAAFVDLTAKTDSQNQQLDVWLNELCNSSLLSVWFFVVIFHHDLRDKLLSFAHNNNYLWIVSESISNKYFRNMLEIRFLLMLQIYIDLIWRNQEVPIALCLECWPKSCGNCLIHLWRHTSSVRWIVFLSFFEVFMRPLVPFVSTFGWLCCPWTALEID